LGDVLAGRISGRENDQEIIIFDSTCFDSTFLAIQDIATGHSVYKKAVLNGKGMRSFPPESWFFL